jgi:DNA polymerase III subunit alpha
MYIIFDTETTGLPKNWNLDYTHTDNWPRAVQIAWQLHDDFGNLVDAKDFLIKADGFDIPYDAEKIHGISTELANQFGEDLEKVAHLFNEALDKAKFVVGQNVGFDKNIMGCEFHRLGIANKLQEMPVLDTCTEVTASLLKLPGGRGGKFKLPTLSELHIYLFNEPFAEAHNATADVEATTRCFFELIRQEVFTKEELQQEVDYFYKFKELHPNPMALVGLKHINLKEESLKLKKQTQPDLDKPSQKVSISSELADAPFVHLHNHTQFSILQSTTNIKGLVKKTADLDMPAVALTDTGNMMAAFHFEKEISTYNKKIKEERKEAEEKGETYTKKEILPIIGCEFNVCQNHEDKSQKDNGYQIVLLAKNKNGYHNLIKLASIAYTKGMYYVPRIDKKLIEQYKEDIIVLSGNTYGEIPNMILNLGENQAEEALLWWKAQFGEDFYLEVMRHGQENENRVNETLKNFHKNTK